MLAAVVQLLERSLIRVGNTEYAKDNDSFGLTTFRDRHVRVRGSQVNFEFRGKSGKRHSIGISDRRLARIIKHCRDLPGQDLLQYLDENGCRCTVGSADVNNCLREISGDDFTAKDFRTGRQVNRRGGLSADEMATLAILRAAAPSRTARAA